MQQFNLTRIDQRFAVETELFDVFRFVNKAFFVIGVGIDGPSLVGGRVAVTNCGPAGVGVAPVEICTQDVSNKRMDKLRIVFLYMGFS